MKKGLQPLVLAAILVLVTFGSCSAVSSNNASYNLTSITASSGTLTASGSGTWTFDAGYVAQNTTETVTFTVTNAGSGDFAATGSASFSNGDFALGINGTFTVPAASSNSFTGSFTPTGKLAGTETGTLTLTPASGSPIVINLQGTSGPPSFLSVSYTNVTGGQTPITSGTLSVGYSNTTLTIQNVRTGTSHVITLTGSPFVQLSNTVDFTVGTQPASGTIAYATSETFVLGNLTSNAATSMVIISGQDSVAGPFCFTFTVTRAGG